MSIEQALIARAKPHILTHKLRDIIRNEIKKGCWPDLSSVPVALEPYFQPIGGAQGHPEFNNNCNWIPEKPIPEGELICLRVWISPEQVFDWVHSERFIKQLQTTSFRIGFEVSGNNKGIIVNLVCHYVDIPIIRAAFKGEYEYCELTEIKRNVAADLFLNKWSDFVFRDYFPSPPYSHLFTRPPELHMSPLIPLLRAMASIEDPVIGFCQVIFQPVHPNHNWHRNVEILLDFEYAIKLQDGFHSSQRYAQQSPSGDLRQMAWEVESKANNDKPFFCMALRIAVIDAVEKGNELLDSLSTFVNLFQHGGRPMGYLTEKDYEQILTRQKYRDMFVLGLTYRPGFLVNSLELVGSVHVPPLIQDDIGLSPMDGLETLPARNPELSVGTCIGTCDYAGISQKVCSPLSMRRIHHHFIGVSGIGKSTTLEHMILQDVDHGHGVAVLDPHGDLIDRLLCLIPEQHVRRVIYFNPGDPNWVPLWNPLDRVPGQDIGRMANDLVEAIKSFVASGGWGDRLANILRNLIYSLLHLSGGTFLDIFNLLRNKSKRNDSLIQEIMATVDNQPVQEFWRHDYKNYSKNDLSPPINKLSKLLVSGTVSLMLSQPENRFDFRKIMDEGNILLIDLSNMGISVKQVLGSFILSILHINALSRHNLPIEERKQFHAYCDEAHNFLTDSIENLIAETRKYRVSLNLAHQYLSQFNLNKRDALSTVGSTIIFKVDKRDADYLSKDLQGKVKPSDLISLKKGEAYARIGTDVVKIKTLPPLKILQPNFRDQIIERSRKQYYKPTHEIKKGLIRKKNNNLIMPLTPHSEITQSHTQEFIYDEF